MCMQKSRARRCLRVSPEAREGDEMQPEAEGVNEEHPPSPAIMMASAPESPSLEVVTH